MRNSLASVAFSFAMLGVGRASAAALSEASTFEPSSVLITLAVGALVFAAIVLLPALVLSIAWPTAAPPAEDDAGCFTAGERPTIPEPSSVQRARLAVRS